MHRNVKLFKFYSLFDELLILGPVIVIYLLAKGLSFSQIMLLNAFSGVVILLFEIPTGAVADLFGRKTSILVSKGLWIASLVLYITGTGFIHFLFAELLFSIGITLKSGADIALLYDTLIELDDTGSFTRIQGTARSNLFITQAFGSIAAGLLYTVNPNLPFLASIGFIGIALVTALLFEEPPIRGKQGRYGAAAHRQIMDGAKMALSHPRIRQIMVGATVFFALMRCGFWLYQPYMETVELPVASFGFFFFGFNMVAAWCSRNAHRLLELMKDWSLIVLVAGLGVSFLILGLFPAGFTVVLIGLQQAGRGLYRSVVNQEANPHIPSDKRSTMLSVISMSTSLGAAAALPILGVVTDRAGVFQTHLGLALLAFLSAAALTFYYKPHSQNA